MRHWIPSVLVLFLILAPLSAQDKRSPTRDLDAAFPEVPQEVLDRYLASVWTSPLCEVAKGLPENELVAKARLWSDVLGLQIEVESRPLIEELQERAHWPTLRSSFRVPGPSVNGDLWMRAGIVLLSAPEGAEPDLNLLGQLIDDESKPPGYRVPPNRVPDLQAKTLHQIRILHPASTPLEEEALENMDLPSAVKQICDANGLGYAFRSDGLEAVRVSLKIQGRSARRILQLLDSVAGEGCHVYFDDLNEDGFDGVVTISEVEEELTRRKYLGVGDPNVTPMQALEDLVLREGKEVAARRPVAVFQTTPD